MYEQFLKLTGLANMNGTHQLILIAVVLIGATILGFVTDAMLQSAGFGPIGNAVFMILGFIGGAIVYSLYLKGYRHQHPYLPFAAPIIGTFSTLLLLMIFKAVFKRN